MTDVEIATADAVAIAERSPVELYDEVVDRAELVAVQLRNLNFEVKPEYYANKDKHAFHYGVQNGAITFSSEHGLATASITAEVAVKVGRKKVLACTAFYEALYVNLHGCDGKAVNRFVGRVGKFTCYPYFRALVATIDANAGTQLPALPVLREKVLPGKSKKAAQK